MDGFFVCKLKKFSNIVQKSPEEEEEEIKEETEEDAQASDDSKDTDK